jgi:nucleotidyltransferase substrate binding protein (TIGR01987 family)
MKAIDVSYLRRCTVTLLRALELLQASASGSMDYDMYRSACIKEFEIIVEQSGKLLRKALKPYFSSSREVDRLTFKDVFRHAVLRGIITAEECERWLQYRDSRNVVAHAYGAELADKTLATLPLLAGDAARLAAAIEQQNPDDELC